MTNKKQLRFKLDRGATLPTKANPGDAGYDLTALGTVTVRPRAVTMAQTGVHVAIPAGYFGLLVVRSSLGKRGIIVATGASIIDSGYRGNVGIPLTMLGAEPVTIDAGARIAQLVIVPCLDYEPIAVAELPDSERGQGGFGSTGA